MDDVLWSLIANFIGNLLIIWPLWRIHERAGLDPVASLLIFIPFVGFFVVYLMLAFRFWPRTELY